MNHKHAVCTSKIVKHVHQKDINCNLHLIKQSHVYLNTNYEEIPTNTENSDEYSIQYYFLKNHSQLSFLLRGPPISI